MWKPFSLAAATAVLSLASLAQADPTGSSENLGSDLLGDGVLDRLIEAAEARPAAEPSTDPIPPLLPDLDELRRMLEPKQQAAPREAAGEDIGASPLVRISGRMATAGDLIAQGNLSGDTRQVQEEIVSELDQLIDKLNKQCQSCQNCQGGQCNKPGTQQTQQSTPKPGQKPGQGVPSASQAARSGPAQSKVSAGGAGEAKPGEVTAPESAKELWGQLPERLRQQLMQSSADEFLPKYRAELEEYFRRLAEEESE